MTITFRCGHTQAMPDTYRATPRCDRCGEDVVSRVSARAPRFVGTVRGPCAEYQELAPLPVRLSKESVP